MLAWGSEEVTPPRASSLVQAREKRLGATLQFQNAENGDCVEPPAMSPFKFTVPSEPLGKRQKTDCSALRARPLVRLCVSSSRKAVGQRPRDGAAGGQPLPGSPGRSRPVLKGTAQVTAGTSRRSQHLCVLEYTD